MSSYNQCDRCGKQLDNIAYVVKNYYPIYGCSYDTVHQLCDKCREKFNKYISKKYDDYFIVLKEKKND